MAELKSSTVGERFQRGFKRAEPHASFSNAAAMVRTEIEIRAAAAFRSSAHTPLQCLRLQATFLFVSAFLSTASLTVPSPTLRLQGIVDSVDYAYLVVNTVTEPAHDADSNVPGV